MHVLWENDPRVHTDGLWSRQGRISKETPWELESLENLLSTFLVKRDANNIGLPKAFILEYNRILVPFDHAETLLNYLETCGHTYCIKGEIKCI